MTIDQYFLEDDHARKAAEYLDVRENDEVLEIGPGKGSITQFLSGEVTAIELDETLAKQLQQEMPDVNVVNANALKTGLQKADKIISAIPYSISKDLLIKILRTDFKKAVIVCQDEFAQKTCAKPGEPNYKYVSAITRYYSEPELKEKISRTSFSPQPRVDSRIVVLEKKRVENKEFEGFVKKFFRHKRKQVLDTGKRPGKTSVKEFIDLFERERE